jgi:hypothetical protein
MEHILPKSGRSIQLVCCHIPSNLPNWNIKTLLSILQNPRPNSSTNIYDKVQQHNVSAMQIICKLLDQTKQNDTQGMNLMSNQQLYLIGNIPCY